MSYRTGFVESLEEVGCLPAITIAAADLPEDVLAFLDHLLALDERGRAIWLRRGAPGLEVGAPGWRVSAG